MTDFNDLASLFDQPLETCVLDSPSVLDTHNSEREELLSFSPIFSPPDASQNKIPESEITLTPPRMERALPNATSLPPSSTFLCLPHFSPVLPSDECGMQHGNENVQALLHPSQAGIHNVTGDTNQGEMQNIQNTAAPVQQPGGFLKSSITCIREPSEMGKPSNRSSIIREPQPQKVSKRPQLEIVASHCLLAMTETNAKKLIFACLQLLSEEDLFRTVEVMTSMVDDEHMEKLWSQASARRSSYRTPSQPLETPLKAQGAAEAGAFYQVSPIVSNELVGNVESTPVGSECKDFGRSYPVSTQAPNFAKAPLQCYPSIAVSREGGRMKETAEKLDLNDTETERPANGYDSNILPAVTVDQLIASTPLSSQELNAIPFRVHKGTQKQGTKNSTKRSSRNTAGPTRKGRKGAQKQESASPKPSPPPTVYFNDTPPQQDSRINPLRLAVKRKLSCIGPNACAPSAKRIAIVPESLPHPPRPMSEAAKLIAKKHEDVRRRNMEKRLRSVPNLQESSTSPNAAPSSAPSRFCHLCTRAGTTRELLVCSNVKRGSCRKVICHRCIREHKWDMAKLQADSSWTCTHCRKVGP